MNALSVYFLRCLLGAVFFVLNLFVGSAAGADPESVSQYRSRLWSIDEELSGESVQAIAQTADGYMWVGTQNGLARFDGERFEFVPFGTNSAKGVRVNSLSTEGDNLWVGTGGGLFQFRKEQSITHELPVGINANILSLRCGRDGSLWLGTLAGLVHGRNEKFSLIGDRSASVSQLLGNVASSTVRAIADDDQGNLWVCVADRLIALRDEYPVDYHVYDAFNPDFIRSVCFRRDGSIWIGCNSGLIRFQNGSYTRFSKSDGLPDSVVTAVYEDLRGNLWIGTYGGLCRFTEGGFAIELTAEGNFYDQIHCFFEDRENNFWVGAKDGLYQLRPQRFSTYTVRHGLAHNNVISVYEDAQTNLWVGTWGGGLHRLNDGKWTIHSAANTKALRNDLILSITGSRDGGIWFSEDYDSGLYHFKNGEFQRFEAGRNAIRSLMEDRDGRLWLGRAANYLSLFENEKLIYHAWQSGLPTNAIRCLLQTTDQRIWVGTEAGLCLWTNGGFKTLTKKDGLSENGIFSLYEDKAQNLWIGTGGGLNRFSGERFTSYQIQTGSLSDVILEILEDDFENLWLATKRGVVRVAKSELEKSAASPKYKVYFTLFGKADGMASPICVGVAKPSAFKTKDGRLWFATTKGLAVTDPTLQTSKNEKVPPVVVEAVIVDKKRLQEFGARSQERETEMEKTGKRENEKSRFPVITSSRLHISPGRGELEFHYTALSYTSPEKNRFKYKLEGFDGDWIDAGTRREAFYNRVPPGDYTFRVIACNNDGVWNEAGSSVKLALQPHFWQTLWFKSLVAIMGVSFVAGGARYVTRRRMQLKLERLEQQHAIEKERARIARDMHDDIGARLTEIVVLSEFVSGKAPVEAKPQSVRVTSAAREIVRNLDALVWAVNPKNDSVEHLALYLGEYVEMFLGAAGIRYTLDMPEELPCHPISSEARHNLFLVVKEALNNVVKHAQASEVWIRLQMEETQLSLSIEDNGKGFPANENSGSPLGNGLSNMEQRMKSVGGKMCLSSEPGRGTRVQLMMPMDAK